MPNLVGLPFQAAQEDSRVTSLKLQLDGVRRPMKNGRPGIIVDQEPSPGSVIKPGMRVTVYVAVAPPPDPRSDDVRNQGERGQTGRGQTEPQRMPNLVGQRFDSAPQDSRVVGLKLRLIPREQPTNSQRPGTIISHEPKPGDPVRPGSSVVAVVAVAPPQRRVEVPRVVGMRTGDGTNVLTRRTLNPEERYTNTTRAEAGTIVDQDPEPGTLVPPNSTVLILVARRPFPPPLPPDPPPNQGPERNPVLGVRVPQVEGMEVQQGVALVSKFNLTPRAQGVETDRAPPGTIVEQNPKAGTLVVPPFTVTVVVARRPPPPPPPEDVAPPPPRLFPMPDLVGRAFPQAERDPRVTGLQLRLIQQVDMGAGGLPNTIVRQSVSPGTEVPMGQAVTVFVASGVAVPRVVQQQADAAADRIVAVGLNPRRSEETSEVTPGTVLRQVPEPGVLVARGASVGITVAVPPKVMIPNVVGRTRADAIQELTRLRLRPSPVDDGASPLPPEQVVSQVPGAGTEVVIGAAVRIGVATGVEVPNLSGLSPGDAQRAVAERGLSFEDADQETDAAPAGQVFQQQPASGTRVTRGSRVLATVATAVTVLVPSVVGLPRQRAVTVLEAAGLRIVPESDAAALGRLVERQQPAANARVARLTPVTLFVAVPPPPPPATQQPVPATPLPPAGDPAVIPPPAVQATPPVAVAVVQPGVAQQGTQPGVIQAPSQSGGATPAVAVPVQPVLPPWLLSLLVAIAAIGASTFKLWWPARPPPAPPIQSTAPATPPPAVDVRPERGDSTLRLEVSGRSLISIDVRVRVGHGSVDHTLSVEAHPLIADERRLYE
jgi:beta-lactam-binding protein with PASTA domain